MANISDLVNVGWYLGVPFNDTAPFRLDIVKYSTAILGDRLLAIQGGNEPDLYGKCVGLVSSDCGSLIVLCLATELVLSHTPPTTTSANLATWLPSLMRKGLFQRRRYYWDPVFPTAIGFLNKSGTLVSLKHIPTA